MRDDLPRVKFLLAAGRAEMERLVGVVGGAVGGRR